MKKTLLVLALTALLAAFAALAQAEIPDGIYVPDSFAFSGGTGRVSITCPEIRAENGEVSAVILFSSPNYTNVRTGETNCSAEYTDQGTLFVIPASLNRAFSKIGRAHV